ncbi:MAG TPA: hypothetical protein VKF40_12830 [Burkholderiales bacterium]|nr:hypothetical protein [Burkholderiales bacterium]
MARRALRQSMWLLIAWLLGSGAASALGQGVAMVTDVTGQVTGPSPVTILSEIAADTRMQVDPGGRLVVIYLKSGDEYTFTGPAQIQFRAVEPQVTSGSAPQKRVSPLARGGNVAIKPVAVTQAAFVMRSVQPSARIRLLTLSGAKTLETAPEFRWRGLESGARYRFELNDDTGKLLFETEITGNSLKLPPAVQLREGVTYAWEVSTRGQDGRRYVGAGEFTLAASPVRAQAAALRPAAGTPVSDRVAYAAWLEQMELKDEARKYWKSLAAERPDDARLKALAAD